MSRLVLALAILTSACTPASDVDPDDSDTVAAAPCDDPTLDGIDGVACEGDIVRLSGTITTDLTLTPAHTWVLLGGVFIGDDTATTTWTVDPGTTVYGDGATDGFLVVQRSSRLIAEGTAVDPIVFTSDQEPGARGRSDWGGLVINGRAPTNVCLRPDRCSVPGEAGTGTYGGDDPDDDSGVLSFVRVEFAGTLVNDKAEINGVAFQGVGRGTHIDQLHAHMVADDGVEFFGGTVDARHVIVTGSGDDGIDWTDGWSGHLQYGIVQHHEGIGDNGIEADNNADDNDLQPRSAPWLQNLTLVGGQGVGSLDKGSGMLLREGTHAHIRKAVVVGYTDACVDIDDPVTFREAWDTDAPSGNLDVSASWFHCPDAASPFPDDAEDGTQFTIDDYFRADMADNTVGTDPGLTDPFDPIAPGWLPLPSSPLLDASGSDLDDDFFEPTSFAGAMGTDNWASWTSFPAN